MISPRRVKDLIGCRTGVTTIRTDSTVEAAAETMKANGYSSLVVVDRHGEMLGIITERDIVHVSTLPCDDPEARRVSDIMTTDVICCAPEMPADEAIRIMIARHVRHLPVVRNGKPVAMISSRDVLVHQLDAARAMMGAAEETARLIKCLRHLDLDEVCEIIYHKIPLIFQAKRWVCRKPDSNEDESSGAHIRRQGCVCPEARLLSSVEPPGGQGFDHDTPEVCEKEGASGPRVFLRLESGGKPQQRADEGGLSPVPQGFECMCGVPPEAGSLSEAIEYKIRLMQDVLNTALANATLYGSPSRHGFIDSLTGLKTRQVMNTRAAEEYERASTSGSPSCLAILNVDNMEKINQAYGYGAGDQVLRDVAGILLDCAGSDAVITCGREAEFMLLLQDTTLEAGLEIMENLQAHVAREVRADEGHDVTFSCGIVECSPCGGDNVKQVLSCAEQAMNEAKQLGRNRIVMSEPQTASR